jgi:PTS system mannose-specific IIA component
MIGIVIVAHGELGRALADSAEMILGEKNEIVTVSIASISENVEKFRENILKAIDSANNGEGVVVFTDLFGGTPCNLSISTIGVKNVEIVAGVNLPMILKILTIKDQNISISEAANLAQEAGKKQITVVSELVS